MAATPDTRCALVTGAGQGVGLGIARALAESGAAVTVNDLDRDRAEAAAAKLRTAGGTALAAPFDVTDLDAVRAGVERIESELGPIDILVNNAGVPAVGAGTDFASGREAGLIAHFKDSDPRMWHRWIDLNLYGSMNCLWAVLGGMVRRGWGRVIQISSGSAFRPQADDRGRPYGLSVYGASKAGIDGLIRHVAVEVARDGVTANSLALGLMDNHPDARILSHVPAGRCGTPAEAGAAVVWLCSELGGYVTGQTIHLNGGDVLGR